MGIMFTFAYNEWNHRSMASERYRTIQRLYSLFTTVVSSMVAGSTDSCFLTVSLLLDNPLLIEKSLDFQANVVYASFIDLSTAKPGSTFTANSYKVGDGFSSQASVFILQSK